MRIAYFDFVVHFGGAQKATVQIAERLARHHEVHMIDAFGTSALYHAALRRSNLPTHVLAPEVPRPYVGMRHSRIRRMAGFARHAVDMLAVQRRLAARTALRDCCNLGPRQDSKTLSWPIICMASTHLAWLRRWPVGC